MREFLESSINHIDLGGLNPKALKITSDPVDYDNKKIKNHIPTDFPFGPNKGYIPYMDNFSNASIDLVTVESAMINDFLYAQMKRTIKSQGQFIIEIPTDLGTAEYLRIANEIGGTFDSIVDIVRSSGTLKRITFTKI